MKKLLLYMILPAFALTWAACKKTSNYPGGVISPYIPLYDLRNLYKGSAIKLTKDLMYGSEKITGIVVSDYSGNNMPSGGYLMVQDHRRLSLLRGIAIPIGGDAAKYASGDSVVISVTGGTLTRANGTLQIQNISPNAVEKISGNNPIPANRVPSSSILKDPSSYESTLVAIVKGGFDPLPTPADNFAGDKIANDGFENITLHTDASATFATNALPVTANFYGVVFNNVTDKGALVPQIRMRKADDIKILSSTVEVTPIVISGFINDVSGGDGNYEYIQLLATQDIDFSITPFSVVVTNNAGASVPAGYPANGWATGGGSASPASMFRTFKFSLTTGTAKKGTYFYVGGAGKTIDGSSSTSMASSNWIRSFNYTNTDGDGFGARNGGFFANSGNAFGMAVFAGTTVTKDTQPIDVLFVGSGGQLFSAGPPAVGYKIANTDFYDVINPITLDSQPYYRQGSNTLCLAYTTPADQGFYYKLGGIYNPRLGKWVKARTQSIVQLTKKSTIDQIETEYPAGLVPTGLKD